MSNANFGILSSFDHNIQAWKDYKGRLFQYFVANDINVTKDLTATKRKAILLSALTEGSYRLAVDLALPKAIEDVPYEDIIKLLDSHFIPKRVGFGERHSFYAATQQSGETYAQWAARLRGLTAYCDFKNVEETLRDKFIMGMQPGRTNFLNERHQGVLPVLPFEKYSVLKVHSAIYGVDWNSTDNCHLKTGHY